MSRSKFYDSIKNSKIEREVEDVYNKGLALYFDNATIKHPFNCDGLIDTKVEKKLCKLIIEYKYNENLKNAVNRASIIVQVLYYIKKFESNGLILPNICLVGDINECFVFHTNDIQKYLSYDIDWSISPSEAHIHNPELVMEISEDEIINPFIFNINENFSFKEVADKIKDLAINVKRLVNVTEHNIAVIFEYFCNNVIKDLKSVSPNDLVAIFINAITDHDACYIHPKKGNVLCCNGREVSVNGNAFSSFFSYFNRNYTPQEKSNFSKISDRLIEDTNRRNKGEFYTPTLFVDKAHRMIEAALGEDWKEKYVVWDNCCGTKNLTRDYRFGELYCSTLEQGELDQCDQYNQNSTSFQFDFLNDSLDKLPTSLVKVLKGNKPIVFLLNPPYANNTGDNVTGTKEKICYTKVREDMIVDKMDACIANLYAQFLYRINQIKIHFNLTNCHIALFSPTLFLTGQSFEKFREVFLRNFAFDKGVQFKASHFADCADNWGISFSLWHNGETTDKNNFNYINIDSVDGEIVDCGEKIVYNADGLNTASKWVRELTKGVKTYEAPNVTSAITIKTKDGTRKGMLVDNALGYLYSNSNNINKNAQSVGLFSTAFSAGIGVSVTKDNFDRCTALFAARRLVKSDWQNWADEYLSPNTEHPAYNEFVNNSLIYSLFESKSNQSSLRNVEYKGRKWNIKNEFFFMSKDEIEAMANEAKNDDCWTDAHGDKDRYVYTKLQGIELSAEAQAVLDKAREIVAKTFKYRAMFNAEHPEYQVNNWDAGWYQIKAMANVYCKDDMKEFSVLFKALSDKMRPLVYEIGFLKN